MTLSREETEAAYAKHRAIHERGAWAELADLFAPDATYDDPFFGHIEGREAIRAFLIRSMTGLEDWTFPIPWKVVGEGRVVTHWFNRLPGQRADGSHFEFPGVSMIAFRADGQIDNQRDLYDRMLALQVIAEAKSRVVQWSLRGLRTASKPLIAGAHWLAAR